MRFANLVSLLVASSAALSCSSSPSNPPIDTSGNPRRDDVGGGSSLGGNTGATGAGTGGGAVDGGEAGANGATPGNPIPPPEGGVCTSSNCLGCCTPTGECVGGTLTSQCGSLGATCISCTLGTMCAGGLCIAQPQ